MGAPFDPRLRVPEPTRSPVTQPGPPPRGVAKWEPVEQEVEFTPTTLPTAGPLGDEAQKKVGFNGTITSAVINNSGQNDVEPGDVFAQAALWRGRRGAGLSDRNRLKLLCSGQATRSRAPSGMGAIPVMGSDILVFTVWSRLSSRWQLRVEGLADVFLPPNWDGTFQEPDTLLTARTFDVELPDPAAGSDFAAVTVPSGVRWLVKSFRAQLVTDGTVADREFFMQYTNLDPFYQTRLHDPQQASETRAYNYAIGGTVFHATEDAEDQLHQELPVIWLNESTEGLDFSTTGLVAGDQWSAGILNVKERIMVQ